MGLVYGREGGERWEGMGPWALVGMVYVLGWEGADAGEDLRQRLRTGGAARRAWSHSMTHQRPSILTLIFNSKMERVRGALPLAGKSHRHVEHRASSTSRRCELLFLFEALLLWPRPDRS